MKICPFCGAVPIVRVWRGLHGGFTAGAICLGCGANSDAVLAVTSEMAQELAELTWNEKRVSRLRNRVVSTISRKKV